MAFGFFDWLRVRTRDSILSGASEAGRTLEQGSESLTQRTEAVTTFDRQIQATPPVAATTPDRIAALPTAPPQGPRTGAGGHEAKSAAPPRRAHDARPTSRTPKTQDLLDARPGPTCERRLGPRDDDLIRASPSGSGWSASPWWPPSGAPPRPTCGGGSASSWPPTCSS